MGSSARVRDIQERFMTLEPQGGGEYWVVSMLVVARDGTRSVIDAEQAAKIALWQIEGVAQPVVSTISRLSDLSESEEERWRREMVD
jgi:hypothetical protein